MSYIKKRTGTSSVPICLKKNNGYSDIVLPEVIFNIPIVIRPARAIPKRTISDSID